jgi:hypothetical protein
MSPRILRQLPLHWRVMYHHVRAKSGNLETLGLHYFLLLLNTDILIPAQNSVSQLFVVRVFTLHFPSLAFR